VFLNGVSLRPSHRRWCVIVCSLRLPVCVVALDRVVVIEPNYYLRLLHRLEL